MQHTKYSSIVRATKVETLVYFKQNVPNTELFYATEKVHGTNFSFLLDGDQIKYAQRSSIIESIFGSHLGVHKVEGKLIQLQKELGRPIQVYCEYYGKGIIKPKHSINYGNEDKDFIFFDIYFKDTNEFMEYPANFELFDKYNIPRVEVLHTGTLDECISLPLDYNSYVNPNVKAEGYVVKPFKSIFLPNNSRVILKMISEQFDDQTKKGTDLVIAKQKQENFNNFGILTETIENKVNSQRVANTAAKFNISSDDRQLFSQLLSKVIEDINSEIEEDSLKNKIFQRLLAQSVVPFIKNFFDDSVH